jgi:hypothetical protein
MRSVIVYTPHPELLKGLIKVVGTDGKHCTHSETRNSCKTLVPLGQVMERLEKFVCRWKEDVRNIESQGAR